MSQVITEKSYPKCYSELFLLHPLFFICKKYNLSLHDCILLIAISRLVQSTYLKYTKNVIDLIKTNFKPMRFEDCILEKELLTEIVCRLCSDFGYGRKF